MKNTTKEYRTNAYTRKELECDCGNKHELHGGKGFTPGSVTSGTKFYYNEVYCKACGAKSTYKRIH